MDNTRLLSREAILNAHDLQTEDVAVPEWGGTVRVRSMTGAERDAWETAQAARRDAGTANHDIRARFIALCAVDASGGHVFSETDVKALSQRSAAALDRVFTAAARLSGLLPAAVEDAAKNSESAPSDDSYSD